MNILVIGGAGYIGSHVTYELCDQGYKVTVVDNLSSGFIDNVDKRSDFIEDSFVKLSHNLLKDIDCVIHLAALKAAGESMEDPIKYSNQNRELECRYDFKIDLGNDFPIYMKNLMGILMKKIFTRLKHYLETVC